MHFLVELRGYHEEQFCEIILNIDQCMAQEEILLQDISYLELWWTFFLRKGRLCAILIEGIMTHEEYFCEIILHWTSSSRNV